MKSRFVCTECARVIDSSEKTTHYYKCVGPLELFDNARHAASGYVYVYEDPPTIYVRF